MKLADVLGHSVPLNQIRVVPRSRVYWASGVIGICLLSAIAATWPLLLFLTSAIPIGTEHEATVPLASLWSLWWNADRIGHGFAGYWDAPIFFPQQGVFAFSEPNTLTGLLVAPLWWWGMSPALIYNIALLGILTLNGIFAYQLARALELSRESALSGAVLTVTLPFVAKSYGVLPTIALFGMLWTLEGLVRFGRNGSLRSAIWASMGILATCLTCQQYALMFAPFAGIAGLLALAQQRFRSAPTASLIGVGLSAVMIVVLTTWPVIRIHEDYGFFRSERLVRALSAQPGDFLTRPSTSWLGVPATDESDTGGLFPGMLLWLLALGGVFVGVEDQRLRSWTLYLAGMAMLGLVLALGLNIQVAGGSPFELLRTFVPGFAQLRTPFRFVAIAQCSLALLATIALMAMQTSTKRGVIALMIVGVLAAGENLAPPFIVPMPDSPQTPWTRLLRSLPNDTVLAHVPFPSGLAVGNYEIETWRMFAQIDHGKPIVNGYSSYFPQVKTPDGAVIPTYTHFQLDMAQRFPTLDGLCTLNKSLGVTTLVVDDLGWLEAHQDQIAAFSAFLQPTYADQAVRIYQLQVPESACQRR